MDEAFNAIRLQGRIVAPLTYGHEVFGERFFYSTISVPRLSGAEDFLPVTISERLISDAFSPSLPDENGDPTDPQSAAGGEPRPAFQTGMEPPAGMDTPVENLIPQGQLLALDGQLRSYNKVIDGAGRLLLTAFAQRLVLPEESENPNQVQMMGALCKPPSYRTTPFGREIADLMVAVNRAYGKSDYIPCIAWGRTARYASHLMVGDKVQIQGRFQSRPYQKQLPDGTILNKTAYEVSIGRLTKITPTVMPMQEELYERPSTDDVW